LARAGQENANNRQLAPLLSALPLDVLTATRKHATTLSHIGCKTLGDLRRSMSAPPTERWLRSMIDPLLAALEMLHDEGVYHRDIAPDNVLVNEAGQPVLLDFGAARHLIADRSQAPTAIIKPRYAPIEQYASDGKQGPATDIYALAAVMHHAITGAAPPEATARVRDDPYKPLVPDGRYAPRFISAINTALSVFPESRPRTIQAWRESLRLEDAARAAPAADANDPEAAATRVLERSQQKSRLAPEIGRGGPVAAVTDNR
jgi:serine/threonine protein kinase